MIEREAKIKSSEKVATFHYYTLPFEHRPQRLWKAPRTIDDEIEISIINAAVAPHSVPCGKVSSSTTLHTGSGGVEEVLDL